MMPRSFFKIIIITGLLCSTSVNAQITPANNTISIDVSTFPQNAGFNYDSCFALGTNTGMGTIGLFQNWTAIETAPNTFNLSIFDIANYYYPLHSMPIDLTITPIHTNNLEVPSDLTTTAFNSPVLIDRFKTLLDSVKAHTSNIVLSSLVIGSEHDVYLGSNATAWAEYTCFYDSVSAYAKVLWPGLKVATELTFSGITTQSTFAQTLNTNSDYIGVSYYPLNTDFTVKPVSTIPTDFATLVGLYPSKPICFYQYGYPSSATCNSSETLQADFITQTFTTWDTYATHVKMIDFTWLHDLDTAAVNICSAYYGVTDTTFLEFLHTLGMRAWNGNGVDKAAFTELQCQAKQRGYNALDITCATGNGELRKKGNAHITIYPNPANNALLIQNISIDAVISMYDMNGRIVFSKIATSSSESIDVSSLTTGMYSITVTDRTRNSRNTFVKQ